MNIYNPGIPLHELHAAQAADLRQDWADRPLWDSLAQQYSLRLPRSYLAASDTRQLRKAMSNLGINSATLRDMTGMSVAEFCTCFDSPNNKPTPAYAVVGSLLETYDIWQTAE